MSVTFERTEFSGRMTPFWREPKVLPGGFSLAQTTFPIGTFIKRGAFVAVDFDTMSGYIVKVGKVITGGTTSAPRVSKDNNFVVGDTIMVAGNANLARTISAIDRSNADYDVLTLSGALTGATAGAFVQEGIGTTSEGATTYAGRTPNMMLSADLEIQKSQLATLDCGYEAIVLADVITPFPSDWLLNGGPCLKFNPNIIFIKQ